MSPLQMLIHSIFQVLIHVLLMIGYGWAIYRLWPKIRGSKERKNFKTALQQNPEFVVMLIGSSIFTAIGTTFTLKYSFAIIEHGESLGEDWVTGVVTSCISLVLLGIVLRATELKKT